jgi:hypothetical protein
MEFPCPYHGSAHNILVLVVGVLAQLVERLVRNEKVRSSSLLGSTKSSPAESRIDLRAVRRFTTGMKRFASLSILTSLALLSGCTHLKSKPPARPAIPALAVVTPDNSLAGKVVSYNSVGRFVVLNFPSRLMPQTDQRLFLYRAGLRVAEVKVTGPQNDDNTVADLVSGDAQAGDEVRDR